MKGGAEETLEDTHACVTFAMTVTVLWTPKRVWR